MPLVNGGKIADDSFIKLAVDTPLPEGGDILVPAERFLGDKQRAAEIFEANRNVLSRPDLLPVGVTIMLPAREVRSDLEPVGAGR